MVVVPGATPDTRPVDEFMVAVAVETDVHTPPASPVGLLSPLVPEGHVVNAPVIAPALGSGFTVTILVAAAVPQLLVTV